MCSLQGAAEWPGSQTGLHLSNARTGGTKFISQLRLLTLEKAKEFGKSEAPSDPLDTYQLGSKRPCSSMSSQGPFWLPLRVPGQLSRCVSACDTDSQGWVFLGRLHGGVMQACHTQSFHTSLPYTWAMTILVPQTSGILMPLP